MSTAKETIKEIVDELPDDSSYDEILRELAFARMVQQGVEDYEQGRTISHDEMKRRIEQWKKR